MKKPLTKKSRHILIAMSGGVDSSVAAALLVRAGYTVTGAFMKQWVDTTSLKEGYGDGTITGICPWKKDRRDALRVAAHLGIELMTLDFEQEYKQWVMEYLFREYEVGRTPNPDVLCNTHIKFGAWLKKAREMGFEYLATGHYARLGWKFRISNFEFQHTLKRVRDEEKDQTYFLHQLSQEQLQHILFPIGHLRKSEVRSLARKFGLPTAERPESMGICFVGERRMKEFLQERIQPRPGNVVLPSGEVVGQHDGLAFYTIGQRHLGVQRAAFHRHGGASRGQSLETRPLYVVEKRFETNELVVGPADDPLLFKKEIVVSDLDWIAGRPPRFPLHCQVRLRHGQPLQKAVIILQTWTGSRPMARKPEVQLRFTMPQRAPAGGQFAVLYKKNVCLGGGVIQV